MISGVGSDLISVIRVEEKILKLGDKFIKKIFTESEIIESKKIQNKANFFAKRFAAKEAFSKAIGLGIGRGVNFLDIEIFNNNLGKPEIRLLNNKNLFLQQLLKCEKFVTHLSLSDEKTMAIAMVIIEIL